MKPFSAASRTAPALKVQAFGVSAVKKVAFEVLIGGAGTEAFEMGLTTRGQFSFVFFAPAVGAV
jgi:hypothetical protein